MELRIARIISIIFHPLLIPTYLIAALISMNAFFALVIPEDAKWKIVLLVFITSAIIPLMVLFGMYRFGLVSSLNMDKREERLYPYIATSIFFFLTYYLVWQAKLSPVFYYCLLGASLLAVITLLINFRWKVSAHTVSMGGVLGAFFGLQSVLLIDMLLQITISILIGGLVGYARLRAGTHSQAQVYAGYFLGFVVMYLLILYY
ncbi:MAG TPA: hypothetical protein VK994_01030 [Bacteroidales bacterium]|nr:hypothetical protein [Bacteroidales bacterium]